MKLWSVAVLAAAALIGIVGASYWSVAAVAVISGLLAVAVGIGWPHLLDVPAKKTQGAVLALAGAGACAAAAGLAPRLLLAPAFMRIVATAAASAAAFGLAVTAFARIDTNGKNITVSGPDAVTVDGPELQIDVINGATATGNSVSRNHRRGAMPAMRAP